MNFFQNKRGAVNMAAIGAILAVVAVVGIGTVAYIKFSQPSPEEVLEISARKLADVDSMLFGGDLNFQAQAGGFGQTPSDASGSIFKAPDVQSLSINFNGGSDVSNLDEPKVFSQINVTTQSQGVSISIGLETRSVGKISYVQLTQAPNLGIIDLTPLQNKWIKIDPAAIASQLGTDASKLEQPPLTAQQQEQLRDAFKRSKIFQVAEVLKSETLENQPMFHFRFTVNEDGLKAFLAEAARIISGKDLTAEELRDIDKGLAGVEFQNGEIWIGRKDFLPYQIKFGANINPVGIDSPGTVTGTVKLRNYNQPVQVEAPDGAMNIEELLASFLGGSEGIMAETLPTTIPPSGPKPGTPPSPPMNIEDFNNMNFDDLPTY